MFKFSIFLVFVMIFSTPVFSKDNKKSAYKNINIKTYNIWSNNSFIN